MEFLNTLSFWLQAVPRYPGLLSLIVLTAVLGISLFFSTRSKQARLRELGSQAYIVPYKLPFGIDCAIRTTSHLWNYDFFEWTQGILKDGGRTAELHLAGTRFVMTDDCSNVKAVMFSQFSDFGKGEFTHAVFVSVLGDSVFATDGKQWVENKNQLRPHLSKSRPTDFEVTEKHVRALISHLDNGGHTVEVYDLVDRLQLDVVTDVFFGCSTLSLDGEQQPFRDAMDTLLSVNTARILAGPIALWFPDTLIARTATNELNRYMDMQVDKTLSLPQEQLQERKGSLTLMEALALRTRDRKFIKNQLIAVLLAGKDPVAITITWALYELARNPEIARRLREEVVQICGVETPPDANTLNGMTLLKHVIRETLRLYHPLGFNIREAKRDTTIPTGGGPDGDRPVPILKGEHVAYSVIGIQRRTDLVGADADQWRPDRYRSWTPQMWEFIPFNHGPRICLGRAFGYFQMEYILARIFQHFERIEWDDTRVQRIKVELNTKMAYPVNCSFHKGSA